MISFVESLFRARANQLIVYNEVCYLIIIPLVIQTISNL